MKTLETKTVAEVVTENIRTAPVLSKYGIEFCCNGEDNLQTAAEKANLNYIELKKELLKVAGTNSPGEDLKAHDLSYIIDQILSVHHAYYRENIPLLKQYALVVVQAHAKEDPELIQIQRLFSVVARQLRGQMRTEKLNLFPSMKQVITDFREGTKRSKLKLDILKVLIKGISSEYNEAGAIFRQIKILSNNFTLPERACNSYITFYSKLQEFQQNLYRHVHLENNLLFPGIIEAEEG
jgi:regulator of cell morphogenesis and NO signaling